MAKKSKVEIHPTITELQNDLLAVNEALKGAYLRFDYAIDPELIDACIYEINYLNAKYNYLLRCVKEQQGQPVYRPHAVPVPQSAAAPCIAAAAIKGGNICQS